MSTKTMLAGLLLLSGCGDGDAVAGQAKGGGAAGRRLDVAGVRPGMSVQEVEAVLRDGGWTVEVGHGRSWEAEVSDARAREGGAYVPPGPMTGVSGVIGRKGDERVVAEMKAVPSGAVVQTVRYEAPLAGRTLDQARAEMAKRYGPADVSVPGSAVEMGWCPPGERCRPPFANAGPSLRAYTDTGGALRLFASEGRSADEAWKARLRAATGGGKPAKSSF